MVFNWSCHKLARSTPQRDISPPRGEQRISSTIYIRLAAGRGNKNFISAVDICSKSMQEQDTLIVGENARLNKLCDELKSMVRIKGPHDSIELYFVADLCIVLESQRTDDGIFIVMRDKVLSFLSDS